MPPLELALQMAAPFLVERGIDPAPDGVGPALIMRLLFDLSRATPTYFRVLAEQPRMADALWAAIREWRMAGLTAEDLRGDAFATPAKHAELRALLRAYEAHLTNHRLADAAAVHREALCHLDVYLVHPDDLLLDAPDVMWAPLERRFLDALPGRRIAPRALEPPGLDHPRRLARLAAPAERVARDPASDADRLAFLMRPDAAPPPRCDGTLVLFRAGGREAEIEEVSVPDVGRELAELDRTGGVAVSRGSAHSPSPWFLGTRPVDAASPTGVESHEALSRRSGMPHVLRAIGT